MDYKKKYKDALADMKVIYPKLKGYAKRAVEHIFPELKESEDERIINQLISLVRSTGEVVPIPANQEELIVYLEKQKDEAQRQFNLGVQAGREEVMYETEKEQDKCPEYCVRSHCIGCSIYEKQKEQKSIEDVVKDITKDKENTTKFLKSAGIVNDNGELSEMYRSDHKPIISAEESLGISQEEYNRIVDECIFSEQKEQMPVDIDYISGIRDELLRIEDSAKDIDGLTESQWVAIRAAHRLLGEYLEQCEQQKPAEWSEEDERNLYNTIEAIKYAYDVSEGSSGSRLIAWLKFHLRPQHHWKPSKEQMKCLEDCVKKARDIYNVCNMYTSRYDAYPTLKSLYHDLKKLM